MARRAWVASALVSEPTFRSEPSYRRSLQPAMPRTIGTPGQVVSPRPEFQPATNSPVQQLPRCRSGHDRCLQPLCG
jgi:hypothetical protein